MSLEEEVNRSGPGVATFVKCDVSKEDEVKVSVILIINRCLGAK